MFIPILASVLFVGVYAAIALEHPLRISKTAFALLGGGLLWVLVALNDTEHFREEIATSGGEIFQLVIFLLAAMSLVEILIHYRFFDVIRGLLFSLKVGERSQFLLITLIAFFLSAVIDNLTTTIVSIQIARKFFKGENLLVVTVGIVIAANAGGAFSPIGDITTIMLWLAGKFGGLEIIWKALLPAAGLWLTSMFLLSRRIKKETADATNEVVTKLSISEEVVISFVLTTFFMPLVMSLIGLPPYLGLLIGLGVVWILIEFFKRWNAHPTHLQASIDEFIKKTDIPSLNFFIGILLAVSALQALGILEALSHLLYGPSASLVRAVGANVALGFFSAIIDNIPLTAIAINILHTDVTSLWILLAISVGTGGSLLAIGSAAGVVAMGMLKDLSFGKYFRIGFIPALVGFACAVMIWVAQYFVFGI